MTIDDIEIYEYTLPLKQSFLLKGEELKERKGLVICLNQLAYGEIAPLPGFSEESLEDCATQIKKIVPALIDQALDEKIYKLNGKFEEWLGPLDLYPSVRFGLEMAVLHLYANAQNKTLHHLISKECHEHIRTHGLLQGNKKQVLQQAKGLLGEGFTALKLKVGGNLDEDIAKVQALSEEISGQALLHVDANQGWDMNKAVHFSHEVGLAAVDYVEEPFDDITLIPDFCMKTTIPVALDESLRTHSFEEIKSTEGVDILVLKPTLLGGIEKTWAIMQQAQQQAIETMVSSSFESDLGILTLACIAGCERRDHLTGLDTLKYFDQQLLLNSLEIKKGKIDISGRSLQTENISFNAFTKI